MFNLKITIQLYDISKCLNRFSSTDTQIVQKTEQQWLQKFETNLLKQVEF